MKFSAVHAVVVYFSFSLSFSLPFSSDSFSTSFSFSSPCKYKITDMSTISDWATNVIIISLYKVYI